MFNLNLKFSFKIIFVFIALVIIGTLSHEFGHFTIAKSLGYNPTIHYGSTVYDSKVAYKADVYYKQMLSIYEVYKYEIDNNIDFEKKKEYFELNSKLQKKYGDRSTHPKDRFLITLGGPLQTIFTSFLGLLILYKRKSNSKLSFNTWDWFGVFLSLFILREVFNTVSAGIKMLFFDNSNFTGDEFRISQYLGLNEWIIPLITAIFASLIVFWVIFKAIPKQYRNSFIVAGFVGGLIGFAIWFGFLGPLVLP